MVGFLISLVVFILIIGLVWWLISLLPIEPKFKLIIQVLLILICILVLIQWMGWGPSGWGPAWGPPRPIR